MDLPRVSGTKAAVNTVPHRQMPPYKKKVPDGHKPSKRSTNVLAIKKPQRKAKQMMMELAMLLTLGGSNSAEMKREKKVKYIVENVRHI